MLLESEDWVWAACAVRAEIVTMTLGLGILVPSWNRLIHLLELYLLSLEMFAVWLSLPFLLVSNCAHPWTLGRALRRNIPCLCNSLSLSNSPGIGAPFPFSRVYLRAWRQGKPRWGWPGSHVLHQQGRVNILRTIPIPSQCLRLSEQRVLPEDGICVLEIHFCGKQVPDSVFIFTSHVQFIYFHTFKWGLLVRAPLRDFREWVWVCYWQQFSLSLVKNLHLDVACIYFFTIIYLEYWF